MSTAINQSVDKIADGLSELASHLSQPDALHLLGTHQAMERLHEVLPLLSNINVAFAYVCERDKAGTLVGANHAVEYLTERLGMSRSQAFNLLEQARLIWGKPNVPEPEPAEDADEAERKRQEEEAARRRREAEEAQERARRAAAQASEEKKRIITQALKQLNEHADPGAETIMAQALEAADTMTPEELRKYVTNLVSRANKKGKDYEGKKDPLAAWKKRGIWLGAPDADGGSELKGYLDAASRALLEAALAAGDHLGSNMDGADAADRDTRRKHQRRCDQLDEILRRYGSASSAARGGVGTVVITLTLEDLLGADAYTQFTTNTSVSLTPIDIVRLGLAGDSFLLQLDSATGVPLSLGRARFASVGQRLARHRHAGSVRLERLHQARCGAGGTPPRIVPQRRAHQHRQHDPPVSRTPHVQQRRKKRRRQQRLLRPGSRLRRRDIPTRRRRATSAPHHLPVPGITRSATCREGKGEAPAHRAPPTRPRAVRM
nr:13E12 repeat family protein [Corynebacterium sp. Marseille-P4321]